MRLPVSLDSLLPCVQPAAPCPAKAQVKLWCSFHANGFDSKAPASANRRTGPSVPSKKVEHVWEVNQYANGGNTFDLLTLLGMQIPQYQFGAIGSIFNTLDHENVGNTPANFAQSKI